MASLSFAVPSYAEGCEFDAPGMLELAFLGFEVERGIDSDGEIAELRQRVTKKLEALRASSRGG